jgi:uncharacterized protein DUF6982
VAGTSKSGLKVVARLRDGKMIKGYVDTIPASDFDALFQETPFSLPREIGLRPVDSSKPLSLSLDSLKALFFVKSFEGRTEYREVKFFEKNPSIKGLWVRVKFYDNEHLEGVVRNSLQYLVEPGFFLKPPDLQSNNEILYVIKNSLIDFRVLGVSADY